MRSETTIGMITVTDDLGIVYYLCKIEYTVYEDETFEYVFTPNYSVIDIAPSGDYQGIPGLDLDLRKERYVRKNVHPVFITERTPSENRVDLWDLLKEVGMDYLNRLEWAIRSKRHYHGDRLDVIRYSEDSTPAVFDDVSYTSTNLCRKILSALGRGNEIIIDGLRIEDVSRGVLCSVIRSVLRSDRRARKEDREYTEKRGRKSIVLDPIRLLYIRDEMTKGHLTSDAAAERLGVSKATMYRCMKENGIL